MKQVVLSSALFLTSFVLSLTALDSPDKDCEEGSLCIGLAKCQFWTEKRVAGSSNINQQLRAAVCNRKEKGVCCPQDAETEKPTYLAEDECGISLAPPSRVFGGEETSPGEFPFLALLGIKHRWTCAGTLINKWYVLTAAHCSGVDRVRLGAWKVEGFKDINDRIGLPAVQDFEVGPDDFTRHPLYRRTLDNVQNDIALIRLPSKVHMNAAVQMACLPLHEKSSAKILKLRNLGSSLFKKKATVVGWGYSCYEDGAKFCNESNYIPSTSQNKLQIPILHSDKCASELSGDQMCAGGEVGKDVCKGDSGGGLFYEVKDVSPWYLLGIVSFGSQVCAAGEPSVFTRVSSYVPWIRENLLE